MSQFSVIDTPLHGLKVIERKLIVDNRGFLGRIFCANELIDVGWKKPIAQVNQTMTKKKGTVRGLHFQNPPYAEMKLISCLHGEIWDIAVDLRRNSPTFLKWHAEKLSSENCKALLIPEGFAHGFQTLADNCELLYVHSTAYMPASEGGIHPKDPYLKITWPLDFYDISARDTGFPFLNDKFKGLEL